MQQLETLSRNFRENNDVEKVKSETRNPDMDPLPGSKVLCEGWISLSLPLGTKPIPEYLLFKAKWRRLWFVLQQGT